MPARSKIALLPEEIKAALDKELISRGFADYGELAEWLDEQGFEISRSALHRYGQGFEQKCEAIKIATEQAKAIVGVVGDDEGNMNEALIRLIQQQSFDILIKNSQEEGGDLTKDLPKMGIMVARLSRASVDQKKFAAEARKKALSEAADAVENTARQEGVSPETIMKIRRDVLMMAE
jgi:hypothetical protein